MRFNPLVSLNTQQFTDRCQRLGDRLLSINYVVPLLGLLTMGSILGLRAMGCLQYLELQAFDAMMRSRPAEGMDPRIVIVGITESDMESFGIATIPDTQLAQLIQKINQQSPAVIGLDLYRNLPNDQGFTTLEETFQHTSQLIGVQKLVNDPGVSAVQGNSVLVAADRVAASDVMVDLDGRVRRGFLFPSAVEGQTLESLGFRVAYEYLARQAILPEPTGDILEIQGIRFPPIEPQSGGYVQADSGGYQVLLNWRVAPMPFQQFSVMDVLQDRIPQNVFKDRIVMIGDMQPGNADIFFTAYSDQPGHNLLPTHGVEIHSHLVSQIVSTVLEGRPLVKTLPEPLEILLILLAVQAGIWLDVWGKTDRGRWLLTTLAILTLLSISYGALLLGWWLPLLPGMMALLLMPLVLRLQKVNQLQSLSSIDELTQLTNRRAFKEQLAQEWSRCLRSQRPLSLIICDVDYFKLYNDTYGHLQGDECLRQVAQALKRSAKRPGDLVARYGGEEFVFLLPDTAAEGALVLAQTVVANVQTLKIAHKASQVSAYVTVSLGVTSVIPSEELSINLLIDTADQGLYEAKRKGRNQTVLRLPWAFR